MRNTPFLSGRPQTTPELEGPCVARRCLPVGLGAPPETGRPAGKVLSSTTAAPRARTPWETTNESAR